MLKIGNLKLAQPFILAPMAGISDLPFRRINRKFGCELAFTEMLNVRSLGHKSKRTQGMLTSDGADRPLGVQILGAEERFILRGLDILRKYKFDILDFNAACPVKKVTARGEGAALLKDPKKLGRLLKLIVRNSGVPVTVKIRTGWNENSVNARQVGLCAEDAGAAAVFIHGRTKTQEYSGPVNYEAIRDVQRALSIPVIASGNVFSAELAQRMFSRTGCGGVLVARGALGNPWIFKELERFFKNGAWSPRPEKEEITGVMLEHLAACVDFYGPRNGVVIFRKFFHWYTKGTRRVRVLRERASRAKTKEEMSAIIKQLGTPFNPIEGHPLIQSGGCP